MDMIIMKICRRTGGMGSGMPNAHQLLSCVVARAGRGAWRFIIGTSRI